MEKKSAWLPRVSATTGLLLLLGSGCVDFDALSSQYGSGGSASGSAGRTGSSGAANGGSHASGGSNPGGSDVGAASGEAGQAGEAGVPETGGMPGTGGGDAQGGGGGCKNGQQLCPDSAECTDLNVGTPDGTGVTNCGMCGTNCRLDHASSATCSTGTCAPICQPGYGNCNTSADNDGCETDISTPPNCGACKYACSLSGATGGTCLSGHCAPTCASYYADCNAGSALVKDDGCEVYLDSLTECKTGCGVAAVACDPLMVCNAGTCGAASGLVVLSTPAPTVDKLASRYADLFNNNAGIDLDGSTVTVRLYAPGATAGVLWVYLSDAAAASGSSTVVQTNLVDLSQKWTDISILAAAQGTFNPKNVKQLTIEAHFEDGPGIDPTLVYVDSVRTSNLLINHTFDTTVGTFVKSTQMLIPGSTFTWAQSVP